MNIDFGHSSWQSTSVRLRAIEPSDWDVYYAWNRDDDMTRRRLEVPFPQSQHEALGFQREGQWRRTGYTEGKYFDHLFFGLTVEEFATKHLFP